MPDLLDRRAILQGAIVCLLLTGPAAILLSLIDSSDDGDESNWVLAILALIVAGFLLGGARAGRQARRAPFVNGALATLSVFVLVQAIAAIVDGAQGDGINGVALVFNALLAASIGTVGCLVRNPAGDAPDMTGGPGGGGPADWSRWRGAGRVTAVRSRGSRKVGTPQGRVLASGQSR